MRQPLFRVKIEGDSMWPDLVPGRTYWVSGWLPVRAGRCVVFRNPEKREPAVVVKKALRRDGIQWVVGGLHGRAASFTIAPRHIIGCIIT